MEMVAAAERMVFWSHGYSARNSAQKIWMLTSSHHKVNQESPDHILTASTNSVTAKKIQIKIKVKLAKKNFSSLAEFRFILSRIHLGATQNEHFFLKIIREHTQQ